MLAFARPTRESRATTLGLALGEQRAARLAGPWQVCLEEAWAAYRAGSLPIGAVVVSTEGAIVGRGRNRIFESPTDHPPATGLAGHRLAHAEINALLSVDHASLNLRECVLYTTLEPCALCVGAIRMLHIPRVRYAARDPIAGGLQLLNATPFMRQEVVEAQPLGHAELEAILVALHVDVQGTGATFARARRWRTVGRRHRAGRDVRPCPVRLRLPAGLVAARVSPAEALNDLVQRYRPEGLRISARPDV